MKNTKKKINLHSSGFTLMETLIAAMILIVVSAGVVVLTFLNLRNAVINKHRLQATWLAEQGVEGLRQIRDTHWIDGRSDNYWDTENLSANANKSIDVGVQGISCVATGCTVSTSGPNTFTDTLGAPAAGGSDIFFTRTITIAQDPTDIDPANRANINNSMIVTISVTWSDYGHPRDATIKTKLTNWKKY